MGYPNTRSQSGDLPPFCAVIWQLATQPPTRYNARNGTRDNMPAGRPSKYDPAFCEAVEDFMGQGYSKMAAAGHIGVCYDTIVNWMGQHPEFFQAVKRGQAARTVFLERGLLDAETGPQVTSRIFALKNAAPDEWKDKRETDHTSSDGSMSPKSAVELTDEQLARIASGNDK